MRQQVCFVFLHRGSDHLCFSNGPSSGVPSSQDGNCERSCFKIYWFIFSIRQRKYFNLCWFIWVRDPPEWPGEQTQQVPEINTEVEMSRQHQERDLQRERRWIILFLHSSWRESPDHQGELHFVNWEEVITGRLLSRRKIFGHRLFSDHHSEILASDWLLSHRS